MPNTNLKKLLKRISYQLFVILQLFFMALVYSIGYFEILYYCNLSNLLSIEGSLIMYLLPVNALIVNLYGKKSILLCMLFDILIYFVVLLTGILELAVPVITILLWLLWRIKLNLPGPKVKTKLINQRDLEINETVDTPLLTTSIIEIQPILENKFYFLYQKLINESFNSNLHFSIFK